jgi:hypothetical protein
MRGADDEKPMHESSCKATAALDDFKVDVTHVDHAGIV